MPKRISVRVPEPEDVEIDVLPIVLVVSGEYAGVRRELTLSFDGEGWGWEHRREPFTSRDEATERAVQIICQRVAKEVARQRIDGVLR